MTVDGVPHAGVAQQGSVHDAAVGMIDDGHRGHLHIDRVQEHGPLALDRGHELGQQVEGGARRIDGAALVLTDAPAHELIAFRRLGDAGHHHVGVVGIGVAVQLQVEDFVLILAAQPALAGVKLQVESARLHPAQTQGDVVVHDVLEVVALVGLRAVCIHLIPAGIAVDVGVVLEGGELRGLAGDPGIVGLAVRILAADPGVGIAVVGPVLLHIVPGAGVGFHVVPLDGGVLLEGVAVFLPHPRGAGADGGMALGIQLIQLAVVGVDLDKEPLPLPPGVDGEIGGGHGFKVRPVGMGVMLRCREGHRVGAGLVRIPALEQQAVRRDPGHGNGGEIVGQQIAVAHLHRLMALTVVQDGELRIRVHGIHEHQRRSSPGIVRFGVPIVVEEDDGAAVGRDGLRVRGIVRGGRVMIRMIRVLGIVVLRGQLCAVQGVEARIIIQRRVLGIPGHRIADGPRENELLRELVGLLILGSIRIVAIYSLQDADHHAVAGCGLICPVGVESDGLVLQMDMPLVMVPAAGLDHRDPAGSIGSALDQAAVGIGDLGGAADVHFAGRVVNACAYVPALKGIGPAVGGGVAGHGGIVDPVLVIIICGAAGKTGRALAVEIVVIGEIGGMGTGGARVVAHPLDRPEDRV